jgi:AcrR family transcriptional regulator
LFNESGTGAVSTNHIAAAMCISPGNLYYHFGNKDEIVTVALERLAAALHAAWSTLPGSESGVDHLEAGLERTLTALEEHRFAAREIFSLGVHSESVRDHCRDLVETLAVHLGRALEPGRDDRAPESGAALVGATWVRSLVPVVLSWGSLNELCPTFRDSRDGSDATALARLLRALHRGTSTVAASPSGISMGGAGLG